MSTPVIRTTFSTVTPESAEEGDIADSGFLNEEGEDMTPDEYDLEEGLTAVDKAVKFMKDEGAYEASSTQFHPGVWYTSESDTDFRTGESTEKGFHLDGFTPEQEKEIFERMTGKVSGKVSASFVPSKDAWGRYLVTEDGVTVATFKTMEAAEKEAAELNEAEVSLRKARRDVMSTDDDKEVAEATARIEAAKKRLAKAWAARSDYSKKQAGDRYMRLMSSFDYRQAVAKALHAVADLLDDEDDNNISLSVCVDCRIAIANGDFSGMDEDQEKATSDGMVRLVKEHDGHLTMGDEEYGFRTTRCECCLSDLHGDRFEALILK